MYQSVFVIAEERRECVIATEVSQKCTCHNNICKDCLFEMSVSRVSPDCTVLHRCTALTMEAVRLWCGIWTLGEGA